MKKILLSVSIVLAASLALAQDIGFLVGRRTVEPAITAKVLDLPNFMGKGVNLEVLAFGGARVEGGALFGGVALAYPFRVSDNVEARLGFYSRFVQSRPVESGVYVGLRLLRW